MGGGAHLLSAFRSHELWRPTGLSSWHAGLGVVVFGPPVFAVDHRRRARGAHRHICVGHGGLWSALFQPDASRDIDAWALSLDQASSLCVEEPFLVVIDPRSEEHTSELQSLMRNSYAVFCLK